MQDAYILFAILAVTLALFVWGYWRYDIVAIMALMVAIVLNIIPFHSAFSGFSNPAVVTVASVMVITAAIASSGFVDYLVKKLTPVSNRFSLHLTILCLITAFLSAFMNNVGALALMMPVAIQSARRAKRSPSAVLMPLAFSSLLGGLTTLIGTPPNILIAVYRQEITGHSFSMFSFTPVGLSIAVVGIAFIVLFGGRFIPSKRKKLKPFSESYQIEDYITEIKIPEGSEYIDKNIRELEKQTKSRFSVLGMIRGKRKRLVIPPTTKLAANDILIVEASHDDLQKIVVKNQLELVPEKPIAAEVLRSDKIKLIEAVIPQGSRLDGRSAKSMRFRARFQMNLIAIAREGKPFKQRLSQVNFKAGDVILLQGDESDLQETIVGLGLLPLAERKTTIVPSKAFLPVIIFIGAILLTSFQLMPVEIAFALAVTTLIVFNIIPIRRLYDSIEWPIIFLLGALIPLGTALQTTGATKLITEGFMQIAGMAHPAISLAILMIITMLLTDVMNNAATAIIMAPIAAAIATALKVSIDPFLMAVAVGASSSFLTPIGHQNNVLVMGPGGYKFSDYFKLGLPIELLVVAVGVPMILLVWPLK